MMINKLLLFATLTAATFIPTALGDSASCAHRLLLISVDGLRPDYVTSADEYGLKIPNLRLLMKGGAYATSVRGVLPTVTYPSHTTLITGVSPAKHGIVANGPFDPLRRTSGIWYWYTADIRVPTLWEAAAQAGRVTGNVSWPVTVGADNIDFNVPEYARTRDEDDLKMLRGLATPGLMSELEKRVGPYITDVNQAVPRDWTRTRYAAEMIRAKRISFMTVHLAATDHVQHGSGPFSRDAIEAIEETDEMIGVLGEAIHSQDPSALVCVVSDHGFARVDHYLKLDAAFVNAGLISLRSQGESIQSSGVEDWIAMPWVSGGSAAIVMKDVNDEAKRLKLSEVLNSLAAEPDNGIFAILDRKAISELGGATSAEFWVDLRPGYAFSSSLSEPLVEAVKSRGTHGYSPTHPEMASFFLIAGHDIRKDVNLGEIDIRNIAPTLAKMLGVAFPTAKLSALDVEVP